MNNKCTNWDVMLSAVVFAMNNAVNSTTEYSPLEIVFSQRPTFPPTIPSEIDLTIPKDDMQQYVKSKQEALSVAANTVRENVAKSKSCMTDHVNKDKRLPQMQCGDYVYLTSGYTRPAKNLKHLFNGPYVVDKVCSPHTFTLKDPLATKSSLTLYTLIVLKLCMFAIQHLTTFST